MFTKPTSLIEFILAEEKKITDATGDFTLLLTHIEYVTRIIASHIRQAGLVDILGSTDKKNVYQDEVQKLDEYSNQLFIDTLSASGVVSMLASEELANPIRVNKNGKYVVFFDPIDGSSNIDVNTSVGTIFSIYHTRDEELQPGKKQVAAGYIIYGSSTMFVYSCGQGVNGFTLDPGIGSFLLSHKDMKVPEKGSIYSINEASYPNWDSKLQAFINELKETHKARYVGSMVADIHRTLIKGGIFIYPADKKTPQGKLRLLYEVNPMSYLLKQAGGLATSNGTDPLLIKPQSFEQTVPIALGSPNEVERYIKQII